jgi:Zn-dependent peptidase ImmA (M78 family)
MVRQPPTPTKASKASVSKFAEDVANHLKLSPGDLLEPVVQSLGGSIEMLDPFSSETDTPSIEVSRKDSFIIHLPTLTSPRRNRFTIAHELGHLFLHYPLVQKAHPGARMIATRKVDEDDPNQQRAEWEANWFAASLLMPAAKFMASVAAHPDDIASVADEFGVSLPAAELRAKTIGASKA